MPPAATSTRSCASRRPVRSPQATAAKQVCAGCVVRGPCLEAALQGPQAHDDHTGIFTGTTAKDRVALRSRASMALGTRFMHDRAAAKAALALAKRSASTGPPGSWASPSRRCGVPSTTTACPNLKSSRARHAAPRFYKNREAAEQAWRRAAQVGINQAPRGTRRVGSGVADRLAAPRSRPAPRPTAAPTTLLLDRAFIALNRGLLSARERSGEGLAAWMRRDEE
jgi:hypothetical protein